MFWTGHIDDERELARIYNAADVAVVPSRQDVLAQTATEAQACGIPVVTFAATGVVDTAIDGETGKFARAYDVDELGRAIVWVLADPERAHFSLNPYSFSGRGRHHKRISGLSPRVTDTGRAITTRASWS